MRNLGLCVLMALVGLSESGMAADWAKWRGPQHNGVQPDTTALVDSLEAKEFAPVWQSEKIPADKDGGFGSPVVADGKVYLYCSWRTYHPITERKLAKGQARRLGCVPDGMPEELLKKIEAARASEERANLERGAVGNWSKEWVATHLTEEQQKPLGRWAQDRLNRGKGAIELETLAKVTTILDKTLENQEALEAWFKENGIEGNIRGQIERLIPKQTSTIEDVIACLDTKDGKPLWKKAYPSRAGGWGSSSTPCVAAGKLFVAGGKGIVYCFDAKTGDEVWQASVHGGEVNSSAAYLDGKLFILATRLVALDAKTGEKLWEQRDASGDNSSPVIWEHGGKPYVVCGSRKICCVDAADGKVLWSIPGGGASTPAVSGTTMAVEHGKGLRIYQVSPTEAKLVAEPEVGGTRGGSPIAHGDKVYSTGGREAVCVDAKTGETVWTAKGVSEAFASPILADGKLVCLGRGSAVVLLDAGTGKELGWAKTGSVQCTSPALADGKLYVRTKTDVRCYSLAK